MTVNAFLSSMLVPRKLVPLSVWIILTFPLWLSVDASLIKAVNTHAVCSFNMHSSAGHTCKYCTVIFSLFATIFHQKWPKHVNTTIGKKWFLGKSGHPSFAGKPFL